jgi:integrase
VELEAVLRVAAPALHLAILLARDAGLRLGTVVRLKVSDCDFDRMELHGSTKNRRRFSIPMTSRLRARLLWVCSSGQDGDQTVLELLRPTRKPYGVDAMEKQLIKAKAAAKLHSHWTFHDIRRTTARDLYKATGDIRKVQRFLSHSNPRTTLWYLGNLAIELDKSEIETAINQDDRRREIA